MAMRWDPEALFNLRGIAPEGDIQCSGVCGSNGRRGKRCGWTTERWDIGDDDRLEAQVMLSALGRKHPSEITIQELTRLAAVCLCGNWHKKQRGTIATKWMDQVEALAATTPAEIPPLPSTPERPNATQPTPSIFNFGNPTPPSSQENLKLSPFTSPLGPPIPRFVFGANGESSTNNTPQTEQQLLDARTKISTLTSRIETLNMALAQKDLDISTASNELARTKQQLTTTSDEPAGTRQQLTTVSDELSRTQQQVTTLSSEKNHLVEQYKKDLASQLQKLTEVKDGELRAVLFQHTTELTRLREKAKQDLETQAQEYNSRVQQAERERDAAQTKFRNLRQEAEKKLAAGSEGNRALSEEVATLKGKLESAGAQNTELVRELGDTQEALGAAGQRAVELERKLREQKGRAVELEGELREERGRAALGRGRQSRIWLGRVWRRIRGGKSEFWV
ncbi:hypothetical protein B0T14DRAFT_494161 [Immersiella caudata]|uniref:Uncharacterized protein n=1 Tax=Immersiella caudata TaxID=314043 RepID=A0AA39WVQ7_9PEZI|nr:hypothetical protein B0T14DRAFT_494161 [Immersiella caudata]